MPTGEIRDWVDVAITVAVVLGAWVLWLLSTAMLIWGERRIVSFMQSRVGPNRLGPFGILQTLADGAKLFFKEDITPRAVDKAVYVAAPLVSAVVAMMTFAVIPYGGSFNVGDRTVSLQAWDPDIGILWVLAMGSIGVYGIVLAGWSSGSKYPLLGGVRSSAQMVSYELAMSLGVAAVFVYTGSLAASDIVANQAGSLADVDVPVLGAILRAIPNWHIVPMAPAFLLVWLAAIAETQRPPFDLPEAEGELVAGFHTEYSGAKFAMFFLAEFMNVITMSAVLVTLFFGGPNGPAFGPEWLRAVLPTLWFAMKVFVFLFVFIWLRATLPRLRYDRLMALGWQVLLPLGLAWVLATGFAVVVRDETDRRTVLALAAVALVVVAVLYLVAPLFGRRDGADPDPPSRDPAVAARRAADDHEVGV